MYLFLKQNKWLAKKIRGCLRKHLSIVHVFSIASFVPFFTRIHINYIVIGLTMIHVAVESISISMGLQKFK